MLFARNAVLAVLCLFARHRSIFVFILFSLALSGAVSMTGEAIDNAYAQSTTLRHQTRFSVRFGGLSVGSATFDFDIGENNYAISGSGKTAGVARWFSSGSAKIESSGQYHTRRLLAGHHFVSVNDGKKTATLKMGFDKGKFVSADLKPKKSPRTDPKRFVVIKPEHLHNIVDPASTLFIPVELEQANDPLAVCNRTLQIYDGETRFNMRLSYKTNKPVSTKGYNGYAYVCAMQYIPIAGHKKNHRSVKAMARNRKMEIWLAPIAATNAFTPIRIYVPTSVGTFIAEPEYFGPRS